MTHRKNTCRRLPISGCSGGGGGPLRVLRTLPGRRRYKTGSDANTAAEAPLYSVENGAHLFSQEYSAHQEQSVPERASGHSRIARLKLLPARNHTTGSRRPGTASGEPKTNRQFRRQSQPGYSPRRSRHIHVRANLASDDLSCALSLCRWAFDHFHGFSRRVGLSVRRSRVGVALGRRGTTTDLSVRRRPHGLQRRRRYFGSALVSIRTQPAGESASCGVATP